LEIKACSTQRDDAGHFRGPGQALAGQKSYRIKGRQHSTSHAQNTEDPGRGVRQGRHMFRIGSAFYFLREHGERLPAGLKRKQVSELRFLRRRGFWLRDVHLCRCWGMKT